MRIPILETSSITSSSNQSIVASSPSPKQQTPMVETNGPQTQLVESGGGGGSKEIGSIVDVAV